MTSAEQAEPRAVPSEQEPAAPLVTAGTETGSATESAGRAEPTAGQAAEETGSSTDAIAPADPTPDQAAEETTAGEPPGTS